MRGPRTSDVWHYPDPGSRPSAQLTARGGLWVVLAVGLVLATGGGSSGPQAGEAPAQAGEQPTAEHEPEPADRDADPAGTGPAEHADVPDSYAGHADADGADAEGADAERAAPEPAAESSAVADPVRVRIPAIDVDAAVVPVGLNQDDWMEIPPLGSPNVGWYELKAKPGERGAAVLAAHVDSAEHGPGVLARLVEVEPGDHIHVDLADGTTATFVATANERTPKSDLPAEKIWPGTDERLLRVITSGGRFDTTGSRVDNDIVYAEFVGFD